MNRSRIVYNTEDLVQITENLPPSQKGPVCKMMMDMMNHEAYNNARYELCLQTRALNTEYKEMFKSILSLFKTMRRMFHSMLFRYTWTKEDFELGTPLGKGKFGRVYMAREKKTKYLVAMKVLFKSELTKGRVEKQGKLNSMLNQFKPSHKPFFILPVLRELEIQSRLK